METIDFSYNWNHKLDCDCYTTIRIYNVNKHVPGRRFQVRLKNVDHHQAEIVQVKRFKLDEVNEFVAHLDTGYNAEECKKIIRSMYKDKAESAVFGLILLKKVK